MMLPDEVKDYTETYRILWIIRENYHEFRFNVMNMWVPDGPQYEDPKNMSSK